jgi:cupin fold WbuC family metalloprotein
VRRRKLDGGVYVAEGGLVEVGGDDLALLRADAFAAPRRRARLCAHPGPEDRLHEMIVALDRRSYVRPHRHGGKSESFHMIEGELDLFLFDDDGSVRRVVRLGEHRSGRPFFFRLTEDTFHAPVAAGPCAVFHETTNGPFDRRDARPAPWAPDEGDAAAAAYLERLRRLAAGRAAHLTGTEGRP